MLRVKLLLLLSLCGVFLPFALTAGTYTLTDDTTVTGDPISYNESGLVIRTTTGVVQSRLPWTRFTQQALKQLLQEAQGRPKDAAFVEPFIDEANQVKVRRKEISIQKIERVERPSGRTGFWAMFASPLGLAILAALYVANIFAATEIARFREFAPIPVGAVAAVLPVLSPIFFLVLPVLMRARPEPVLASRSGPPPPTKPLLSKPAPPSAPDAPATANPSDRPSEVVMARVDHDTEETRRAPLPPPQVFTKGEFTFNRRFFESKLPGFFRLVPSEAEKNMVVSIKAARGSFSGRYISRINQTDLTLQVFKDNATADEMIPFIEIQEVVVRHKDSILSRS